MIRNYLQQKLKEITGQDFKVWFNGNERGDYSANVVGADLALEIKEKLVSDLLAQAGENISKIETVNGFINFWLSEKALEKELVNIFEPKPAEADRPSKIQVEFISANPTGPLTLGNGRGGVYGDVLANIFKEVGHDVTKEYYINDAGNQIEILGHSVLKDELAQYKGEYIDELSKKLGKGESKEIGEKATQIILENIKQTVSEMGVDFGVWFSEQKELRQKGKVEEIVNWFKEKNFAYEKDGALWFKASEFGDTEDRVLIKENGEPTYFCVDAAYHKNKFVERKFDKVINVWGADHHGDVARVKGFVDALGFKGKLEIILMQFVRLIKDGRPARMSKRAGTYVLVDEVLKEVGRDAFRYFMLAHSTNTHMDFDLNLAKEQSKKNPIYYIQYAGARMSSILDKAQITKSKLQIKPELQILNSKHERQLLLKLIQLSEILEDISKDYQVQKLATYTYELAKTFTDFYENVRVMEAETEELKQARLSLVVVTRQTLERVLGIMGISAPEKM